MLGVSINRQNSIQHYKEKTETTYAIGENL